MNWLAHFLLSEPTPGFRVGSILPDVVRTSALGKLPEDIQLGIERHYRVDRFTDSHPIVRRSISLFPSSLRRYAGVLVDIFYDHVLAREWVLFSSTPLKKFVADIYASFEFCRDELPPETNFRLGQIRQGNWISTYQDVSGIAETLRRMCGRLRRPFEVARAMEVLEEHYDAFQLDFNVFFPEVITHVKKSGQGDAAARELTSASHGQ
jgi:acyl carrier protein phosphodiesterase